ELTITERLHYLAATRPDQEAMRFLTGADQAGEAVTYAQLWSQSACFAEVLREHVAPGARALLLLSQTLDYMRAFVGCPLAGVMVTHDNILRHTESFARQSEMDASSVLVSWLPLFHDFGMIGIALQGLVLGARSVIMSPFTFTKRPLYWLEAISEHRGTHAGG